MDLKNKKVLVIGTGISGMGAAKLLCSEGAIPIFYDENEKIYISWYICTCIGKLF